MQDNIYAEIQALHDQFTRQPEFTTAEEVPIGIWAKTFKVGINLELNSPIGSPDKPLDYVEIGDNVYIGPGCNIRAPQIRIGDYTKIHRNGLLFGRNPVSIGHNCWFGENTIIDCEGHTTIGNGVGAGAYSQLWSHIRHGDTLAGCRYLQFGNLTVEDDVWFVGSCIVSPIHAHKKSVALVGSVVTRDMEENRIYGGAPAKELTSALGVPFIDRSREEIIADFVGRINKFNSLHPEVPPSLFPQFDPISRTYVKSQSPQEIAFMKFLLPEAKFIPVDTHARRLS